MKVCFLIGSPEIGGGTYVIFEHALHLQAIGWEVSIVPIWSPQPSATPWHPALRALRFRTPEEAAAETYDLAIATWWRTVYDLLPLIRAERTCYFVQSIESWFYPDDEVALRNLVNATYLLPMPAITEARWIRAHLAERFAQSCELAPNGCRKDFYRADGPLEAPRLEGGMRVLVEGPLGVDFKNVARTISLARRSAADEIWLLTSSPVSAYPGVDRVFSRLPAERCAAVYRACDVMVKLSTVEGMFGPPLEMFHCGGTAVVYDVTGHDEYIVDGVNALVLPMGDEAGVVASLARLKRDPALLGRLRAGALSTAAAWPDWPEASPRFAAALARILSAPPAPRERLLPMIAEFRAQYERTARALPEGRSGWLGRGVLAGLRRRFPAQTALLHAQLVESRRQPAPRARI